MHPLDLEQLGVAPGGTLTIASRRGKISLYARADDGMPRGAVFVPFCYYEAAANMLTNPVLDPFGKIPEFKYCAVRVTKGGDAPPIRASAAARLLKQCYSPFGLVYVERFGFPIAHRQTFLPRRFEREEKKSCFEREGRKLRTKRTNLMKKYLSSAVAAALLTVSPLIAQNPPAAPPTAPQDGRQGPPNAQAPGGGPPEGRQGPPGRGRGPAPPPGPGRSNNPFPTPIPATEGVITVNFVRIRVGARCRRPSRRG